MKFDTDIRKLAVSILARSFRQVRHTATSTWHSAPVVVVAVLFIAVGSIYLWLGHATSVSVSAEPENGGLSGAVTPVVDGAASKGSAVKFGGGTAGPAAPGKLQAITGGSSIAVIWQAPVSGYNFSYGVYRDGAQIATTHPGSPNGPVVYQAGTRYIDNAITPGTTYSYQVKAIDSSGNGSALSSPVSVTAPTSTTPTPTVMTDASAAPDLASWLNDTVVPEVKTWYPKVADIIAYPAYTPRSAFKIYLKTGMGIGGSRAQTYFNTGEIDLNADYFRNNPSDVGVAVHEATHVIQGYTTGYWPYWIQEGMADWAQFYVYQDYDNPLPARPNDAYTAGYHPAAYFLQYLQNNSSATFMKNLNVTMRGGNYTPGFITAQTGKSPDAQWTAMTGHAIATGAFRSASYANICIDDAGSGKSDGNKVQNATCDGSDAQLWSRLPQADGSNLIEAFGKCLDAAGSGTADGTPVQLWSCNNSMSQHWRLNSNKTITNVNSGKCLYDAGGPSSGTQLILKACNTSDPGQQWSTP